MRSALRHWWNVIQAGLWNRGPLGIAGCSGCGRPMVQYLVARPEDPMGYEGYCPACVSSHPTVPGLAVLEVHTTPFVESTWGMLDGLARRAEAHRWAPLEGRSDG